MAAATIPRSSGSHRRKRNYVPVVWRLTQQSPEVNKCRAIVVLERDPAFCGTTGSGAVVKAFAYQRFCDGFAAELSKGV